MNVQLLLTF